MAYQRMAASAAASESGNEKIMVAISTYQRKRKAANIEEIIEAWRKSAIMTRRKKM